MSRPTFLCLAVFYGFVVGGCKSAGTSSGSDCLQIFDTPSSQTVREVTNVLSDVANTGRIGDACTVKAAMEATVQQGLRANIQLLRQIAALDHSKVMGSEDLMLEDTIADALNALARMRDPGVVELAREHLNSPTSIAGTAVMTLQSMDDWASTDAVVSRLLIERNLQQSYSFVDLALRFVSASPIRAARACEALQRLQDFDLLPPQRLKSPTIRSILDQKRTLQTRFGCN